MGWQGRSYVLDIVSVKSGEIFKGSCPGSLTQDPGGRPPSNGWPQQEEPVKESKHSGQKGESEVGECVVIEATQKGS